MLVIVHETDDYLKYTKYYNIVEVRVIFCDSNTWFDGENEYSYETMNVDLVDNIGVKNTLYNVFDVEIL